MDAPRHLPRQSPITVSVVLPVYNDEHHVAHAVRSALAQTGVSLEVVVVDDGSSDGTAEVLATLSDDPRLKVIHLPQNVGLAGALNRGLAEASGELIARLDADDLALPGRLAAQAALFADDPSVVLSACAYRRALPSGEVLRSSTPPLTHGALAMAAWSGNRLCHSAVMFRRSTALELGGYRGAWYPVEDFDLWLRMLGAGRFRGTAFVGTHYLVNPDGISLQNEQHQANLARQRATEFVQGRGVAGLPEDATVRQRLRQLDQFRVALHRQLAADGIPTEGVDPVAYQLAHEAVHGSTSLTRQVRVASSAPSLWRAGRSARSR